MTLSTARRPIAAAAVAVLVATFAAGCGSKVDQSNFDKVTTGMSQAQVEGVLGTDKEQTASSVGTPGLTVGKMTVPGMSAKVLTWKDGDKTITITFENDKVASKVSSGL